MSNSCSSFTTSGSTPVQCGSSVSLCPGYSLTVSGCGSCTGDEYLYITQGTSNTAVYASDDGCGGNSLCSAFTYTPPQSTTKCYTTYIQQQCAANSGTCSGVTHYSVFPTVIAYTQYFDNSFCENTAVQGGLTHPTSCTRVGEVDNYRYVSVTCNSPTSDSTYKAQVYSTNGCTGTVAQTIYGTSSSECQSLDIAGLSGVSMQTNCAGIAPTTSNSDSDTNTDAIITGSVLGGVLLLIIVILLVLTYLGCLRCGKKSDTNNTSNTNTSNTNNTNTDASAPSTGVASPVHDNRTTHKE